MEQPAMSRRISPAPVPDDGNREEALDSLAQAALCFLSAYAAYRAGDAAEEPIVFLWDPEEAENPLVVRLAVNGDTAEFRAPAADRERAFHHPFGYSRELPDLFRKEPA
jgi:hypothetical protein